MRIFGLTGVSVLVVASSICTGIAFAQDASNNLRALLDAKEIPVTIDNFMRAASDIEFSKYLAISGDVNTWVHVREPTPVERQPTIRMNRDTLYSIAVIDISEGVTLILPETGDRYISAQIVNQDHFMNDVFVGGGRYTLDIEKFDTPYVLAIVRTLVDSADPEDVAEVHALQDSIVLDAGSSKPFVLPNYDQESFDAVLKAAIELGRHVTDSTRMHGRKGEVDPVRQLLGTAGGWGGLPEAQAFYLNVEPGLPVGEYKIEVPSDVPVDAFWSVSLYNADGFFEPNALGAYNINSVTGERNQDGSTTVHLGGCDDGRVNCLPIMEGWNYTVRLYRAQPEVLDGSWEFPSAEPAS
ncbi:DUF1214 domain-containing protein [Ruegeria atlantica]|uniref:Carboxylesterase n=1 Tax=Ruegeria atlantica TaxID=81569 RepID=A0A0P1F068_9RHOB|nr:DUF1214 domain-containing protein [Ruegeria atlantica]CUH46591.1 hypothetical protein RUA4292_00757 [Ruegeria atlantica]